MDGQLKRIIAHLFSVGPRRRRADLIERLLWELDVNEAEADVVMIKLILDEQIHAFTVKGFNAMTGRMEDEFWIEPGSAFTGVITGS